MQALKKSEKRFLDAHPLCAACQRIGKYKKATVVWYLTNGEREARCNDHLGRKL